MDNQVADFVERLISASPEVASVHRQHIADQGEILPHVLMAEITRLVIASTSCGRSAEWRTKLLQQLESGLVSGSGEVAELVAVSFVENLCGESTAIEALLPNMGNALRKELKSICGI
jgi:hypothetical protein